IAERNKGLPVFCREPLVSVSHTTLPRRQAAWLLAFLLISTIAGTAEGRDDAYLAELTRRAREARLSEQRYWHLLLHYRQDLTGGYTSEADDPGFFMAPTGKS